MEFTKEELVMLKMVVDFHIIDGMGIAAEQHQQRMQTISKKLTQMVSVS